MTHKILKFLMLFCCLTLTFANLNVFKVEAEEENKVVRVGWFESPFNLRDQYGRRTGYAYEYEQKIAAYTGWTYEYVEGSWPELFDMLKNGEIDMLGDVSYTYERSKDMLFPSIEMGYEDFYIFVAPSNKEIQASDLETLNGKKIGANRGSLQIKLLSEWAKTHEIEYELVELDDAEQMADDLLESGEIDAVLGTDSYQIYMELLPITQIGSSDYYFAINKNRPDLLKELEYALSCIYEEDRYYNNELFKTYLSNSGGNSYLSLDELEWLKQKGTIKVGYRDNYLPFSGTDDESGNATGALVTYLSNGDLKIRNADLNFEFIPYNSSGEALEAMARGEVDCVFPVNISSYECEEQGILITNTLLEMESHALIRRDEYNTFFAKNEIVAAVNEGNPNYIEFLKNNFPDWKIKTFSSTKECMRAISNNEADALLVTSYRIVNLSRQIEHYDLVTVDTGKITKLSIAVNRDNKYLYSILNKIRNNTPDSSIESYVVANTIIDSKVTLIDFVSDNLGFVVVLGVAFVVILALLAESKNSQIKVSNANKRLVEVSEKQIMQIKEIGSLNKQLKDTLTISEKNRQQLLDDNEIISSISKQHSSIIFINLNDDYYEVISGTGFLLKFVGTSGKATDFLMVCSKQIAKPLYLDDVEKFLDLSTLIERLEKEDITEIETQAVDENWFQLRFIVKKRNEDNHPCEVLLLTTKVSDLKEKENEYIQKLKDATIEAEAANRAKTLFLNNMSHDIRTPMNAILGYTNLMRKEKDDPAKLDDYLNKTERSGEYLLSIINNVLEIARIDSGKEEIDNAFVDLEDENISVIPLLESNAKAKNQTIMTSMKIQHRYIYADMPKINEIIINLLSNAIKYTPEGGTISVGFEEIPCDREGYAKYELTISDTGIGMSDEFLEHIFELFSRERNTTESKIVGTGLGMSIVKKLVDLLGGEISITSELGKGSTFKVILMHEIIEHPEAFMQKQMQMKSDVSLEGKRILLAEDNELNAEIAMAILEDLGLIVEHAADGVMCLEMLNKKETKYYDLILMDVQMPNLDGYATTIKIRELADPQKANIPIVAMTANAFEEDKKKAYEAGMNGHLAKPINIEALTNTLSQFLG